MKTLDKFLRYVAVDTESVPGSDSVPSSEKQKNLSKMLAEELKKMGAKDVRTDDHAYVYAVIPANGSQSKTKLGFIAHVDTSPAVSGANVKPVITPGYDGKIIKMSEKYSLSPVEYPSLKEHIGEKIICTDGNTLLGADDKAGVAEIMSLAQKLLTDKSLKHGEIKIAFTPDEEVGNGTEYFDIKGFGCDYAYTVDGGALGEIEYENFNAASATVLINGVSIHPGTAKNKMRNALLLAMELNSMLPPDQIPAYTENYEGFYHLDELTGNVDFAKCAYIIRDHDKAKFGQKKDFLKKVCVYLNEKYGQGTFLPEIKDSYYNMKEKILPHMHLIENAEKAMKEAGVEPKIIPIRGGTDGARLSYEGLPCPNLCTGGYNFHGRYEYITEEAMERVVEILLNIVKLYA